MFVVSSNISQKVNNDVIKLCFRSLIRRFSHSNDKNNKKKQTNKTPNKLMFNVYKEEIELKQKNAVYTLRVND